MIDDEAIVTRLRREFPDTAAIYRFGSTVQGDARADSDVDLAAASTVLRMQIVSGGRVLATFDPRKRDIFEDYVFSSYARLNEERRAILEQIAREGRVYGG